MKTKIFLIILLAFTLIFGYSMFETYIDTHTYYNAIFSMFQNGSITPQVKILFSVLISVSIPLLYLGLSKKPNLKLLLTSILGGLLLFSYIYMSIKGGIVGGMGFFLSTFNTLVLFGLGIYFFLGVQSLGNFISTQRIKFKKQRIQEMFFEFGIGLSIVLLLINFLIVGGVFYSPITRVIFISFGFFIRKQKKELTKYKNIIEESILPIFSFSKASGRTILAIILLGISLMYYFYGFQLSFIPYSTAWDANHAYMYCPKVYSENHGAWIGGPCPTSPMLWYSYIAFRFSLMLPFGNKIASFTPSTVAVAMNFLSGILVLFFGIGLIKEVQQLFENKISKYNKNTKKETDIYSSKIQNEGKNSSWLSYIGRGILLLWLTSGMGAFLVFIDNKTDLGVMSLTLLALLSGFIFISLLQNVETDIPVGKKTSNLPDDIIQKEHGSQEKGFFGNIDKNIIKYVIISGVFFALAHMTKMSAFQDIALFGLLLTGIWLGGLFVIGLGICILGAVAKLNALAVSLFISQDEASNYFLFGGFVSIISGIQLFFKKQRGKLKYLLIWGISVGLALLVLKGPQVIYSQINNETLSPSNFIKGILMGLTSPNKAYAQNTDHNYISPKELAEKKPHLAIYCSEEMKTSSTKTTTTPINSCKYKSLNEETLFTGLQTPHGGGLNEDLQRYIGFGQRNIFNPKNISKDKKELVDYLRYTPISLFFGNTGCYGRNKDAKMYCENQRNIAELNISKLKELYNKLPEDSDGKYVLGCNLGKIINKSKSSNIKENQLLFANEISSLQNFRKEQVVFVDNNKNILIPYRYIVPLNVSITNKLQNLSSYYTDIGFIRFLLLCIVILGTIYLLLFLRFDKKTNKITHPYNFILTLHLTTIIGRAIRRAIASAIVRYAVGLIARTILSVLGLFFVLYNEIIKNKTNKNEQKTIFFMFLGILGFWGVIQLTMNFMRISTQGGGGLFTQYKGNSHLQTKYIFENGGMNIINKNVILKQKDIFDTQFGHYNEFLENVDKVREDKDGVQVAGTYLQYFLSNQKNVSADGLLTRTRTWMSDYNTCNLYQRFKSKNIKYIVIDPNILSVVMGDGNSSLKERMFAKINPITNVTEQDGVMTMFGEMIQNGYMKMMYSNNLSSFYAYSTSKEEMNNILGEFGTGDIIYQNLYPILQKDYKQFQAKMALLRFFPDEYRYFAELTARMFQQRIINGQAIKDISYVFGKHIHEDKISKYIPSFISGRITKQLEKEINKELSQDDIFIMTQYLNIRNALGSSDKQTANNAMQQIIRATLGGSSQLMVFELQ